MSSIENFKEFASQQSFDTKNSEIFDDVWKEANVSHIPNANTRDGNRVLSVLAQSEASPEFIKSFVVHAWQQGLPVNVLSNILNSDLDGDGRSLGQELFADQTDPYEPQQAKPRHQSARSLDLEL
ncbi:MAG: hypothetical protein KME21_28985 [Desmonostoc vinosum HA7617-LM4]|jgi:hypothetical protein|nr:hypothetical protein [Desmonostoc vinosum HA7617-LM4]